MKIDTKYTSFLDLYRTIYVYVYIYVYMYTRRSDMKGVIISAMSLIKKKYR